MYDSSSMAAVKSILVVDLDSELSSVLGSYCSLVGMKIQFTTRVPQALRRLEMQRYAHVFLEPNLKMDDPMAVIDILSATGGINAKTPLTLMTANQNFEVPMSAVKRLNSILLKPFSLDEFAFHISKWQKAES